MASRAAAALRTAAHAHAHADGGAARAKAKPVGDYVAVCVALGMIAMSVTLGLHTAGQQLAHAPNVRLDKRKRETVAEVADPDLALHDAERFVGGSVFRRVAQVQDDRSLAGYPVRKAVTLKDVGVDPPGIPEPSREGVLDRIFKKNTA